MGRDDGKRQRRQRMGTNCYRISEADAGHVVRTAVDAGLTPQDVVQWYYQEGDPGRVAAIEHQYYAFCQQCAAKEPTLGERRARAAISISWKEGIRTIIAFPLVAPCLRE